MIYKYLKMFNNFKYLISFFNIYKSFISIGKCGDCAPEYRK